MKACSASLGNVNAHGILVASLRPISCAALYALLALSFAAAQTAQTPAAARTPRKPPAKPAPQNQLSSPATEGKVNALLAKMTLEEKIGQLVQYSAGAATGPTS